MIINMIKISDLLHRQTIRLKRDIEYCCDQPTCAGHLYFTIKANSHLIYDGYEMNDWGIFLKFIHIEECKAVYDFWSTSHSLDALDISTDKFELI